MGYNGEKVVHYVTFRCCMRGTPKDRHDRVQLDRIGQTRQAHMETH